MKVITVTNQKGGVGKTVTTLNLAAALTRRGYKVLMIDIDPQRGNLSQTLHADKTLESMFEVLSKETTLAEIIQETPYGDLATATVDMSNIDAKLNSNGGAGRERRLKEAIQSLDPNKYDFVVIDTPPSLSLLTVNALVAADYVVVTAEPDINAMQGITQLNDMVKEIRQYYNPELKYAGILITKYRTNTDISAEMHEIASTLAQKSIETKVFTSYIRFAAVVPTATLHGTDIYTENKKSNPALDYEAFCDELVKEVNTNG